MSRQPIEKAAQLGGCVYRSGRSAGRGDYLRKPRRYPRRRRLSGIPPLPRNSRRRRLEHPGRSAQRRRRRRCQRRRLDARAHPRIQLGVETRDRRSAALALERRRLADRGWPYAISTSGYSFVDAATDGSKVLFSANGAIAWTPKDHRRAGKSNLYAWDREPGTVRLAGVLHDGTAPAGARGGKIGGVHTPGQPRVSSDADSVYFTAQESGSGRPALPTREPAAADSLGQRSQRQLRARAGIACTSPSRPQRRKTQRPDGTDRAGTQPAEFKAASAEGSIAYFTTPRS